MELRYELRGAKAFIVSMQSMIEAVGNAHLEPCELDLAVTYSDGKARACGMTIGELGCRWQGNVYVADLKPTPSVHLFAAAVMVALPARASMVMHEGWPIFHCPPYDDRDEETDPEPLVPTELVPC